MNERLSSLELVASEVKSELEQQLRHFEGLDTKAGIVLGFAGVLVALSGKVEPLVGRVGLGLAALAALLAVWAFFPRTFPVLDLSQLRERYLTAEPEFTALHLLDTRLEMCGGSVLRSLPARPFGSRLPSFCWLWPRQHLQAVFS